MGDNPNAVKNMDEELKKQAQMTADDWLELAEKKPNSFPLREVTLALIEKFNELEEDVNYLKFLNNAE